jgi:HAMP domain-containing protein
VQRTPITLKLALTLAVPIVALAFATTLGVRSASDERAEVRRQTELARAAIGPAGLLSTLQNERIWVAVDALGFQEVFNAPVASYEEAFAETDAARAEVEQRVDAGSGVVADAYAGPIDGLLELDRLRFDTETFRTTDRDTTGNIEFAFDAWDRYTALLEPFYDATTRLIGDIEDPELREGARTSDNIARGIEAFSRMGERTVVIALLTENGVDTRDELAELSRLRANLVRYSGAIASAKPPYADLPSFPEAQRVIDGLDVQAEEALRTGRISIDEFFASVETPQDEGLFALQDEVHRIINARADELEDRAETRQLRLVTLAIGGMAFVILLNLLVSRSITRPLRSLTRQAREVAQRRLPSAVEELLDVPLTDLGDLTGEVPMPEIEPVIVDGGDELAGVAGALNTVQTSVVDLAARQAIYRRNISDLFVSLNGRNQELLRRQVGLLGELSTPAALPSTHASLSQLDHLAAQMRRNTESLLAVAGVDARRVWQAPVDIDEVVGYALGQVADTRRLVVHDLEPASLAGASASDVVHLLAELVESALGFAAVDDRPIELRGGPKPETGGYWLAVIDFGAIMTPKEVQAANHQLSGDDEASSPKGGYAVGAHLAKRAGVGVRLDSSAGWGVTVTVDIPGDLMVRRPAGAVSAPPDPRTARL